MTNSSVLVEHSYAHSLNYIPWAVKHEEGKSAKASKRKDKCEDVWDA